MSRPNEPLRATMEETFNQDKEMQKELALEYIKEDTKRLKEFEFWAIDFLMNNNDW